MMGWSYSTDGGYTFKYGGIVPPPLGQGVSVLYGDPAMAKPSIDDPYVFLAQEATLTPNFTADSGYQKSTDSVFDSTPSPNAHCLARSTDRGISFPANSVQCFTDGGFHDGTAMAAAFGVGGRREVYVTSAGNGFFWRFDGETLAGTFFSNVPFAAGVDILHPRLRVFAGKLYAGGISGAGDDIHMNRLDATGSSLAWDGEVNLNVAPNRGASVVLADGTVLAQGNPWSFDVGLDRQGHTVVRVVYLTFNATTQSAGISTLECQSDLTGCVDAGWSISDPTNHPYEPSLRYGGGNWMVTWKLYLPATKSVATIAAALRDNGTTRTFDQRTVAFPQVPCHSQHSEGGVQYWGDYDELDAFQNGTFYTGYTLNGPGRRFEGVWAADMHVGGVVLGF